MIAYPLLREQGALLKIRLATDSLNSDLDGLGDTSREALISEWREVVGRAPPKHLSKPLMVQILSHTYQLDTLGGTVRQSSLTTRNLTYFKSMRQQMSATP